MNDASEQPSIPARSKWKKRAWWSLGVIGLSDHGSFWQEGKAIGR